MVTEDVSLERVKPYHVVVPKFWFRQKPVFDQRLFDYERKLQDTKHVVMKFNAGNMIYQMMRRLSADDWEKQDALIYAYRNLVYKISYVNVVWYRKDIEFLHFVGQKSDVMWALSFVSQVYPEVPIQCETIPENKKLSGLRFQIQDGQYVGVNARQSLTDNAAVPDIWSFEEVQQQKDVAVMGATEYVYDANFRPREKELFALPDGRVAYYVSMDRRFELADSKGANIDVMTRHNISASFMKDFEDMVRRQTMIEYDLYQVRYSAFMNKVHILEHRFKGLDATVYDTLPIAERGLPQAELTTIRRTNMMDHDSLKYVTDKVERNRGGLSVGELKKTMGDVVKSLVSRIRGYNIEYYMYRQTHTPEEVCQAIHNANCIELYNDFAKLDSYGELSFPVSVYKVLCNDPENGRFKMTDVERQVLRTFGRGYFDFLSYQLSHNEANTAWKRIYKNAMSRLQARYQG